MTDLSSKPLYSSLSKARGLGSAKDGTGHWVWQRLTAIALIPLSLWFIYNLLMTIMGSSQEEIAAWMGGPLVSVAMAAFLIAMCAHAKLGVQVIIEDYIHGHGAKNVLLVLNMVAFWSMGIISLLAIIKLHLGA